MQKSWKIGVENNTVMQISKQYVNCGVSFDVDRMKQQHVCLKEKIYKDSSDHKDAVKISEEARNTV